ncbi:6-phosphofructokinase [Pseudomonadales bacterium]|jgi:6-phosphofructokinase|nr:6-phosphofructokinase [Pseudomonadales bacterium]MDB4421197.1 6-phosphofructokinase [Pseudomonadales bacterium]MDB4528447.1 6-phosphofructokinase [Pseudomonadales bacterium]MDB4806926.1 6-phosphofructokinase [Pseudomonadales bacterium]
MSKKNALYAQSGGVTAVINASACGVIETAKQHPQSIGKVYAGNNGILGVLREELIDVSRETPKSIAGLRHTPSAAFGSCRYKLKNIDEHQAEYERLIAVFKAHNIGYFFYNGGGDSQDTTHKIAEFSARANYPVQCIGIPKTIDNDLPLTDNCPGFGSVAKYVAISTREAAFDVASMCASSTKIFVLEVMGRHAGWIAAASSLAAQHDGDAPHIILFPEIAFNREKFLRRVNRCVKKHGYCVIVASEGTQTADGKFLADGGSKDAFGHIQLGGVAPVIANMVKDALGYKYHWAVADYLQRSARHIASKTDVDQAYALGKAAVDFAVAGDNAIMPIIIRGKGKRYSWKIGQAPLADMANTEKMLPRHYISGNGFEVTPAGKAYLAPLILGEDYPPYKNGLPDYVKLKKQQVTKKLKPMKM